MGNRAYWKTSVRLYLPSQLPTYICIMYIYGAFGVVFEAVSARNQQSNARPLLSGREIEWTMQISEPATGDRPANGQHKHKIHSGHKLPSVCECLEGKRGGGG